jgi:phage shock protein PspC (stress-responsive transcriptional regulator)
MLFLPPRDPKEPDMTTTADHQQTSLESARAFLAANGLTRPQEGRMLGGVTAGLARRFGANLLVARVAMVVGIVLTTPFVYLPLWVLMPKDGA